MRFNITTAFLGITSTGTTFANAGFPATANLADIVPDPDRSFRVAIKHATGSGNACLGVVEVTW